MADLLRPEPYPRPSLTYLWGHTRPVVNAVAAAWALEQCPDPTWIEIREATDPVEPDPTAGGVFPPERRFLVSDPSELGPTSSVSDAALGSLVRPGGGTEVGVLVDYLTIPRLVRDVANQPRPGVVPLTLVLANCERLRPFWSAPGQEPWAVARALRRSGVSAVVSVTGPPDAERRNPECDSVVEVQAESLAGWRTGALLAERSSAACRLRPGESVGLASLASVVRILDRLTGSG